MGVGYDILKTFHFRYLGHAGRSANTKRTPYTKNKIKINSITRRSLLKYNLYFPLWDEFSVFNLEKDEQKVDLLGIICIIPRAAVLVNPLLFGTERKNNF